VHFMIHMYFLYVPRLGIIKDNYRKCFRNLHDRHTSET